MINTKFIKNVPINKNHGSWPKMEDVNTTNYFDGCNGKFQFNRFNRPRQTCERKDK